MKNPSKAGQAVQAEWASYSSRPEWRAWTMDDAHDDAREVEYKAAERARIAAKKIAQAEAKGRKVAERKARGAAHCQICGGDVLASTGVIAHHGYKRPGHGWQTSSCLGARFAPYEESRGRIPEVLEIVIGHIARVSTERADAIANPPARLSYTERIRVPEFRSWDERGYRNETRWVARGTEWTGNTPSYKSLYQALLRRLEADIAGSSETAAYLKARHDAWRKQAAA